MNQKNETGSHSWIGGWQFGLLGWPLGHSISPNLHQAALSALGEGGDYRLFPIPPEEFEADFSALAAALRGGRLHGLNVTVPYKRSVLPFLDRLTLAAADVGAVNSIFSRDGHIIGDNTDARAFATELTSLDFPPRMSGQRRAVLLGAGGAARASALALLEAGWWVTVAARRLRQAALLVREFPGRPICAAPLDETISWSPADLVVNATPAGMYPDLDGSPWPEGSPLPEGPRVFDLVYNPPQTRLMKMAPGSRSGLGMLVEQAALAFEIWTGLPADRQAMRRAAETALAEAFIPA